ncbi:MAG: type I DNA topoisomerase [Oscillospiraceae bacterium]
MAKNLVIVESPAKGKTIKKYLGKNFEVIASMGHVRDLPKSKLGIDVENDFEPKYINIRKQSETIKKLKAAAKGCKEIYLATDPDREGEAISWHLAYILGVSMDKPARVTFNEITKAGVSYGMANPRKIDIDLVDAQQTRRMLDRLVGYKISPFLWKKVRSGLSAGRVQSVAVRIIVDRENEINAFVPQEYWSIEATLQTMDSCGKFTAKYYGKDNNKVDILNEEQANEVLKEVDNAEFIVKSIKKGVRKKSPAPPFTTSTLQQEASRKLGFQARRTMSIAQQLYEGVDVEGYGAIGLITYMRTDSLRISDEARAAAYMYIENKYGENYIPSTPRVYKTKKNVQDGHEAIRPSLPEITPEAVKSSLSSEQYKLYKLIWERFIASQMSNALLDTVSVSIDANNHTFKASGFSVEFDGFMTLYVEGKDDADEEEGVLPKMSEAEKLKLLDIANNQHFTQPPPRFSEASLIKFLEEKGIGRPSTYAPTIGTILARNYVEREQKQLKPTALGQVTTEIMLENFAKIVDPDFTASMEQDLDIVEDGKKEWKQVIREFYGDFSKALEKAELENDGERIKIPDEVTDVVCELCGKNMVVKSGRFGKFLACPGYPDCKNTKKIVTETEGTCPLCGGKILEKKSKKGKKFFGCEHNPDCAFLSWDSPIKDTCPQCNKTLLKKGGKAGKIYCSNENCDYERGLKD